MPLRGEVRVVRAADGVDRPIGLDVLEVAGGEESRRDAVLRLALRNRDEELIGLGDIAEDLEGRDRVDRFIDRGVHLQRSHAEAVGVARLKRARGEHAAELADAGDLGEELDGRVETWGIVLRDDLGRGREGDREGRHD